MCLKATRLLIFLKLHLIQCLIFNFNLPFPCTERELSHVKRQTSLQKELEMTRGSIEIAVHVFEHLDKVSSLCQCLHVNQLFSKKLNPLKYVIASCSFKVICFRLVVCTIRLTSINTHRVNLARSFSDL